MDKSNETSSDSAPPPSDPSPEPEGKPPTESDEKRSAVRDLARRRLAKMRWKRWRAGIVQEARDIYDDARNAFDEMRMRIGIELQPRVLRRRHAGHGEKSPPREKGVVAGKLPKPSAAHALTKGDAETARSPALRPIQGKEFGTRFREVFIVGELDFFGAALVHQLNDLGFDEITITGPLTDESCRKLPCLKFREYLSPEEFEKMVETRFRTMPPYSHVFYLGGWETSSMGPVKALLNYVMPRGGRFIAVSPATSIGPRSLRPAMDNHPENFRPSTPEGLLATLFDRYPKPKGFPKNYLSLKCHQFFGPGEQPGEGLAGLVKTCHRQLRETGSVRLPAALRPDAPEGRRKFDFYSTLDAARLALFLAQSHIASGVYEVGSGTASNPETLARFALAALGAPPEKIVWDESLPYTPPAPAPEHAWNGPLDETGWTAPAYDLKAAVAEYVKTYLEGGIELGEETRKNSAVD